MILVTDPLLTVPPDSPQYAHYLSMIFSAILTIPLVLNRLPLEHLLRFISKLSLSTLNVLDPYITSIVQSSDLESKIHLASTMYMVLSPQYKALPPPAMTTYLRLSISLFNDFPTDFPLALSGSQPSSSTKTTKLRASWQKDSFDSDSDDEPSASVPVAAPRQPLPKIDNKTIKRFQNLIAAPHLTSIISSTRSNPSLFPHLIQYLFALVTTWPSWHDHILHIVLATTSGGLVRELYRELVRSSLIGKEEHSERLLGELILYPILPIVSFSAIPISRPSKRPSLASSTLPV